MITPYLPTLNLSVDNALSTQQIIHQLITQLNNMTEYLNELDQHTEDIIDDKITKSLTEFKVLIDSEITKALDNSKEYTNIKLSDVNNKLLLIQNDITNINNELVKLDTKITTEDNKLLNLFTVGLKRLDNKIDRVLHESVATVSPITGETKSASDSIYDLSQIVASFEGLTMGDIIRGSLCDGTVTNPPPGLYSPAPQTIEQLFTFKNTIDNNNTRVFNGTNGYLNSDNSYIQTNLTIQDNTINSWCKFSLLAFCCSTRDFQSSNGSILNSYNAWTLNSIFDNIEGNGTYFVPNIHANKYEIHDENYLMFARDVGFLDSNNEPYESGIYPL